MEVLQLVIYINIMCTLFTEHEFPGISFIFIIYKYCYCKDSIYDFKAEPWLDPPRHDNSVYVHNER